MKIFTRVKKKLRNNNKDIFSKIKKVLLRNAASCYCTLTLILFYINNEIYEKKSILPKLSPTKKKSKSSSFRLKLAYFEQK